MKFLGVVILVGLLSLGACAEPTLDDKASSLVDALGPLCDHMDFQLKQDVGGGEVRPVHCSRSASGNEHPEFVLYVFSAESVQEEWLQLPGMKRAEQLKGQGWSIDTDQPELLDEIEERLGG